MKKEEKEEKDKIINQEDAFSSAEFGSDEYGFEYDFFITTNSKVENTLIRTRSNKKEKEENTTDHSKTFFLPDFFDHED